MSKPRQLRLGVDQSTPHSAELHYRPGRTSVPTIRIRVRCEHGGPGSRRPATSYSLLEATALLGGEDPGERVAHRIQGGEVRVEVVTGFGRMLGRCTNSGLTVVAALDPAPQSRVVALVGRFCLLFW